MMPPVPICESKGCFEFATAHFVKPLILNDDGEPTDAFYCEEHAHAVERMNEMAENSGRDELPFKFVGWLDG